MKALAYDGSDAIDGTGVLDRGAAKFHYDHASTIARGRRICSGARQVSGHHPVQGFSLGFAKRNRAVKASKSLAFRPGDFSRQGLKPNISCSLRARVNSCPDTCPWHGCFVVSFAPQKRPAVLDRAFMKSAARDCSTLKKCIPARPAIPRSISPPPPPPPPGL